MNECQKKWNAGLYQCSDLERFLSPPISFCLEISILQKKNPKKQKNPHMFRNRRHSMQKKMLSNLIKLFIFVHLKATEDVVQYILIQKKIQ